MADALVHIVAPTADVSCLTPAEIDLIRWVAHGYTDAQIARQRGTGAVTVSNQLGVMRRKLGVQGRVELTLVALRAGLVTLT